MPIETWVVYVDTRNTKGEVVQVIDSMFMSIKSAKLRVRRINTHPEQYPNQVAWADIEDRSPGGIQYKELQRNSTAKLRWEDVEEIRERHANGEKITDLAAEFNVHRMTISNIVNNKAWN